MCSYYWRYVLNFLKIVELLVLFIKKYVKFKWNDQCQQVFNYIKDSFIVIFLLLYFDLNKEYLLYIDVLDIVVGVFLVQLMNDNDDEVILGVRKEIKLLYYLFYKLRDIQICWLIVEKEVFVIYFVFQKLDYYLYNVKFIIWIDYKFLKYFFDVLMKNKMI